MIDILIGASDGYTWEQLRNWVISSKQCGFKGKRIVIAYRMDEDTQKKLVEHGIEVYKIDTDIYGNAIDHNARVSVGAARTVSHEIRYFHTWQLLSQMEDVRYVILTDIRDVIFQKDPIEFLDECIGNTNYQLIAPSEGILYKDEPWNGQNAFNGYGPYVWESIMKESTTFNCGTIAGKFEYFKNFVLVMWAMTGGKLSYPADQCSFGLLVNTLGRMAVLPLSHNAGWACQCGTMVDPSKIQKFRPNLLTEEPSLGLNGYVYTSNGTMYSLVHQYERVPEWLKIINERYKE